MASATAGHVGAFKQRPADLSTSYQDDEFTTESIIDMTEESGSLNETFVSFVRAVKSFLLEKKGIDVQKEFIVNIVKLAAIDPVNKFLIKQQMVASEVERLRKIVIERIVSMTEISRNVICMQLHYREKYMTRDEAISTYREGIDEKVSPLMMELKSSVPRHLRHYDLYYTKIIAATVYFANMGSDTEHSVVNETRAVIEAVFPQEDISLLSVMPVKDRETELMHVINIAVGLRLVKKDQTPETYGEFIEHLSKNLPKKIHHGLKQLNSMNAMNTRRLIKYTSAIQRYFLKHFSLRGGRRELNGEMVKARQALCMVHQLLIYIKELTTELSKEEVLVGEFVNQFKGLLQDLQKTRRRSSLAQDPNARNSVINSSVYPKYMELCESWQNLVDSNVFVDVMIKLSVELMQLSEKDLIGMDELMEKLIKAQQVKVPTDQEFFEFPSIRIPQDKYALAKRVDYRQDVDPLNMNFSGFCIHSLVRGSGMLVLANPNLGIFTWKNMNFMLASPKAATDFPRDPSMYVKRAIAIARRWPELIILLNIETEAFDSTNITEADKSKKYSSVLISKSSGTQSDIHPVPTNIVEAYTWNEWELRRRGIILSKIHKCRTHGTQTHWQALKKTAECQTYQKKSQEVQTMRTVHTSVPRTKFYFAGLRGYHCGMSPHIVELTTENAEDLRCVCETKPVVVEDPFEQGKRKKKKSIGI